MLASHGVLIPPPGRGILIPNEENQVSSGCSVRNTTAQNIHFVKPPPIANTVPPSRRRVTPASTSETRAADGASNSKSEMTSLSSCGVGICLSLERANSLKFCRQPSATLIRSVRLPARQTCELVVLGYVTPPVPFVIQNSMSRVTPEIASRAAAANSQRPKPRPVSQETTAPKTAPPAPTGAITLPTQLIKFRNAPSGCAPVCP